jgi:hypothetical protein
MRLTGILLLLIVGWTAIGAIGITISFKRGERTKALQNLGWIVGVWTVYLAILLGVSLLQSKRVIPVGTAQCFDDLCFTVTGSDQMPGYLLRDGRLIRVKIDVTNRGSSSRGDSSLRAYLIDTEGRRWDEVPGLSGVSFKTKIPGHGTATSEPVFKLPPNAVPQGLVFTRGRRQPGLLTIGDRDSLLHKLTVARLSSDAAN